jgi:hypothetical protein
MNREVDFFTREICNRDPDAAILIVGSSLEKEADKLKDLDLLLLSNRDELPEALKEIDGYNDEIDGSLRFFSNGTEVGILPCTTSQLRNRVNSILKGSIDLIYKPWAIGAECPEGFLGDIAAGEIVIDTTGQELDSLKRQVAPYPDELRNQITSHCKKELLMRISQLEKASKRGDLNSVLILKGQILFLILRLTYSQQKQYFQGTKSLKYHQNIQILLQNALQLIQNIESKDVERLCTYLKTEFL